MRRIPGGERVETQDPRGLGAEPRIQKAALVSELPFRATLHAFKRCSYFLVWAASDLPLCTPTHAGRSSPPRLAVTSRQAGQCSGLTQPAESPPSSRWKCRTAAASAIFRARLPLAVRILLSKIPHSLGIILGFAGRKVLGKRRELKINCRVRGEQL